MINLPQCVLMCFCKSSVCAQLKSQYARAPHPPTRWDPSPPGSWVRCAGSARPTHPLGRQHPAAGYCPCTRRAETNYPSVINQLRPLQCMTEATSMSIPGLISFVFSWRHNFFRKQREIFFLSNLCTFCVVSSTDGVNLGTCCEILQTYGVRFLYKWLAVKSEFM